jgi:hypothetical protein
MNNKILIFFSTLLLGALSVSAQEKANHKENFFGLGRAVVSNESLTDTTSQDNGATTNGYTLFDLGVKMQRGDLFRAHAILRIRNEFGGFFGDGVSFDFRELRLEGLIANKVKYEIGDLDVKLTPYTIHNFEPGYYEYENELIKMKRDILRYENFYTDENTWRMQGVNAFTTFNLKNKVVKKLYVRMFGNRVVPTNNVDSGDRFVYGGKVDFINSKNMRLGINMANTQDLALTVPDAEVDYDNQVLTTDFRFVKELNPTVSLGIEGEMGGSKYSMTRKSDSADVTYKDGFYDIKAVVEYKPLGLEFKAGWKTVGQNFSSPAAQTRRVNDYAEGADLTSYPTYNDGTTPRKQSIFDRYSQETGLYSRSISTTLDPFNPIYGNINQYGDATPNRTGLTLDLGLKDSLKRWEGVVKYKMQQEVVGQNVADKRKFSGILLGAKFNINRFIGWNKLLSVYGSYNAEKTKRDNPGVGVDLKTNVIDISLDVEVYSRLHLITGMKSLGAKGYEFTTVRNEFNQISETDVPNQKNYDWSDQVIVAGAKYDFGPNSFIGLSSQFTTLVDNSTSYAEDKYSLDQIYIVYQIKF